MCLHCNFKEEFSDDFEVIKLIVKHLCLLGNLLIREAILLSCFIKILSSSPNIVCIFPKKEVEGLVFKQKLNALLSTPVAVLFKKRGCFFCRFI